MSRVWPLGLAAAVAAAGLLIGSNVASAGSRADSGIFGGYAMMSRLYGGAQVHAWGATARQSLIARNLFMAQLHDEMLGYLGDGRGSALGLRTAMMRGFYGSRLRAPSSYQAPQGGGSGAGYATMMGGYVQGNGYLGGTTYGSMMGGY